MAEDPDSARRESNDQKSDRFDHLVEVDASDIDANGHCNNVVYVRWIQDAAVAHWFSVVEADIAGAVSWVVVRHEVDFKRPALEGDLLVVRTWVGTITAATCERFTEVLRRSDSVVLAHSRTVWCMVEPSSGRPKRINPVIRGYFWGHWPPVVIKPES